MCGVKNILRINLGTGKIMSELVNVSILFNSDLLIDIGKSMEVMRRKQSEGFEKSLVELRDMIRWRTPYALGMLFWSINYEMREITKIGPYGFAMGTIGFVGIVHSFKGEVWGLGALASYTFYEPWKYVAPVEHGTVPHWPPWEPMLRWVRNVLNPPGMVEELWTTWKIMKYISQHGTVGAHMFRDGEQEFWDKNILKLNMQQAAEEGMKIITAEKPWWAAP